MEENKSKGNKVIIILIIVMIIIIIGIGILCYNLIKNRNELKAEDTGNTSAAADSDIYNSADQTKSGDNTDNITDENSNDTPGTASDNQAAYGPVTSSDEAVQIVKNSWGEDNTVTIQFDSMNTSGNYVVVIRDKTTTQALYWYTVDRNTGTMTVE